MTVLGDASAIYIGDKTVTKAYLGSKQVWPSEVEELTSEIIQQQTGTWTGSSFTVTLPQAPARSSTLVLMIAGNTVVHYAADWTQREAQVNYMGHYLYTLTDSTDSSWTITCGSGDGTWWIAEVTNAEYGEALGQNRDGGGGWLYATPSLSPPSGQHILIASIAADDDFAVATSIDNWSDGFTEVADIYYNAEGSKNILQGVSQKSINSSGVDSYSTTATFNNPYIRSAIICSLSFSGSPGDNADNTPPTTPSNLMSTPFANSVTITWTASSDNVGVVGYEYSLNGAAYHKTNSTFVSHTITGLQPSTEYIIRLRAFDSAGNRSDVATVTTSTTDIGDGLNLPLEPWHGGPEYYEQFPAAVAQGWNSPTFFPFAMMPNAFLGAEETAWDAQVANIFHGASPWSSWGDMESNGVSWIGSQLESAPEIGGAIMPANYGPWVGYGLPDEIDGTHEDPQEGLDAIDSNLSTLDMTAGRLVFANYTQRVLQSIWRRPDGGYWGESFVNHPGVDIVCIDMYWYTIPDSSFYNSYVPGGEHVMGPGARSAASYGSSIRALRWLDAQDDHLKPVWMYIENLSGSPGEQFVRYIEPHELKAAVISCITNGASGIVWFNNVASETHYVSIVTRKAQLEPEHPAASRIQAAKEIRELIDSLAPVINSQTYVWDFQASTIDTMLKVYDGYAYIFAIPGTGSGSGPSLGVKTFQLPAGVSGTIEVIGENRNITPTDDTFTDDFTYEYTWHIYRIKLDD